MTLRFRRQLFALGSIALLSTGIFVCSEWLAGRRAAAEQVRILGEAYDPLAVARARGDKVEHREAGIPVQCYTKTEGVSNPCWVCHTDSHAGNDMADFGQQVEYAFSEEGKENHWSNLFVDRRPAMAELSDAEILAYIRADNYASLRTQLQRQTEFRGYAPDLDFSKGFDQEGFAQDGSAWRALRYKPFAGVFWPTNGSTDDVLVRLPEAFRSARGQASRAIYKANLALLEASLASDPALSDRQVDRPIEPIDERAIGYDLNGNGQLDASATRLVGLPDHYFGDAADTRLWRGLYPKGTEFLHSVRYLDPDAPSFIATRMKELRYMKKLYLLDPSQILGVYAAEHDEKDEGHLPVPVGSAEGGVRNKFGWSLQGYIEDESGRLRLQTRQEQQACLGCHSNLGVTVDQTFAFARKLPGAAGWAYQDLRGIPDAPQLGHQKSEFATYLERVGGGDEFRANTEILERFFVDGKPNLVEIRRAAAGGDRDFAWLVLPSRERALELDRAYVALVREQKFELGRDAQLAPAQRVHRRIENESTGLAEAGRVYKDGRLRLAWTP